MCFKILRKCSETYSTLLSSFRRTSHLYDLEWNPGLYFRAMDFLISIWFRGCFSSGTLLFFFLPGYVVFLPPGYCGFSPSPGKPLFFPHQVGGFFPHRVVRFLSLTRYSGFSPSPGSPVFLLPGYYGFSPSLGTLVFLPPGCSGFSPSPGTPVFLLKNEIWAIERF